MKRALIYFTIIAIGASRLVACDTFEGKLGHSLGAFLVISGMKEEKGKVASSNIRVTQVNGIELKESVVMPIGNMRKVPSNTRITVRGYETGKMIGLPGGVGAAEGLMGGSAYYQFYHYFIITSVVEPELDFESKWRTLDEGLDDPFLSDDGKEAIREIKKTYEKSRIEQ